MSLQTVAAHFQAQLLKRDSTAANAMLRAYGSAWQSIRKDLDLLLKKIAEQKAAGLDVNQAWLFQQNRLALLLRQAEKSVNQFAGFASERVKREQADAIKSARAHADELLFENLPNRGVGIDLSFAKLPEKAFSEMVGALGDGSPLDSIFRQFGPSASRTIRAELLAGVAAGKSIPQIARAIRDALGGDLTRAVTISRTEVMRAYRTASIATYRENSDLVEGWRWQATLSGRTCFPAGTVVSGPRASNATSRYYSGELVTIRTASGKEVSFTPNHPILTAQGWIPGGLLNVGDNVISSANGERTIPALNVDDYQIPTLIEDVFETFPMVSAEMPAAAPDFHGDGKGSNVYVVRSDGLLGNALNSSFREPMKEGQFCRGSRDALISPLTAFCGAQSEIGIRSLVARSAISPDARPFFERDRGELDPHLFFKGSKLSTSDFEARINSLPANAVLSSQILNGHSGQILAGDGGVVEPGGLVLSAGGFDLTQSIGIDLRPEDSSGLEFGGEPLAANTETWRDLLARLASNVSLDRVLEVSVRRFDGHVFNLETEGHWYSANGIIAHNCAMCISMHGSLHPVSEQFASHPRCRCTPVPELVSMRALGLNVDDKRVPWVQGDDWFASQPEEMQRRILGPAAFSAYKSGAVSLADFVGERNSPQWGPSRHTRSLKEILGTRADQFRKAA